MHTDRGYALITGASQGLGQALALELSRQGFGVLLTARNGAALRATAEKAASISGLPGHVLEQDLTSSNAAERVAQWAMGLGVPLVCLVNNAGQGLWGRFQVLALEEQLAMLRLNMEVPVALTHRLLPVLQQRPRAWVLNVSSMTAYHALATFAVYGGSKSFLLRWSRALRLELRGGPVTVTAVCPGSIITGFTQRARMMAMDRLARRFGQSPESVARTAVRSMLQGRAETVPGLLNKLTAGLQRLLPESVNERAASGIYLKHLPAAGKE
jgi:short-subunit dehydrogenase